MDLYICIDSTDLDPDDLEKIAEPVSQAIGAWIGENPGSAELVDETAPENPETPWQLGINLSVKRKAELKAPLAFLYTLAKEHKQEFVLGTLDKKSGETEEVCYFGFEEGRPDAYEIANYIGL